MKGKLTWRWALIFGVTALAVYFMCHRKEDHLGST